jgi:hypothetical protein
MNHYSANTLKELKEEYTLDQKTITKWISHNCYEAEFRVGAEIYTIQFAHDEKILGIWTQDGEKIDKI